jgi:hypothetical protein
MFLIDLFEVAERLGTERGTEHGTAAASWVFDGNTTTATFERYAQGLADGDPEVLDQLPHADLSGEWADRYSSVDLEHDLGSLLSNHDDTIPEESIPDWHALAEAACMAYEAAFSDIVVDEVERMCNAALAPWG